jgi:fimbrial chaperone protein
MILPYKLGRSAARVQAFAVALIFCFAVRIGSSQQLSIMPVNVFLTPGQKSAALTITNPSTSDTSIQIRAYAWQQQNNEDQLTETEILAVSPPLVTIAAGSTQVVRLILRQTPKDREATYRILLDQIPPPGEAGVIHMVLRFSIPIFVAPPAQVASQLDFHLERKDNQLFLVGVNSGQSHDVLRDCILNTPGGRKLKLPPGGSPYLLGGTTRLWSINVEGDLPKIGDKLFLTAHNLGGSIEKQIEVTAAP